MQSAAAVGIACVCSVVDVDEVQLSDVAVVASLNLPHRCTVVKYLRVFVEMSATQRCFVPLVVASRDWAATV